MKNLVTSYFLEQKNVRSYLVLYVLVAVLLSCLSVSYFSSGILFWLLKVIQLATFIWLGMMHMATIERGLPFVTDKFQNKLNFSVLLTLLICGTLLGFYFFTNRSMLFMALASSCAFFLPYIVIQLLNVYKRIPVSGSMVWYGYNELLDSPDVVHLSSIPITFTLTTSYFDQAAMSFSFKAPLHMELSQVFNLFILAAEKNYNIHIERTDENNRCYGWQFFSESLKGLIKVQLDPGISVGNNKTIKPDTIIFAKRVKAGGAYQAVM